MSNPYKDKSGHFTSEENNGGECVHTGKVYRQNTPYEEITKEEMPTPNIDEVFGDEFKGYKGQAAVDKLLTEKRGHIKGAFHRDDVGEIDLIWGNDFMGLQHIIERRAEQGIDIKSFLNDITQVVQNGNFRKKNSRGNFEFMLNGKIAVIAPEFKGNKVTFLLTAFKTHSKK